MSERAIQGLKPGAVTPEEWERRLLHTGPECEGCGTPLKSPGWCGECKRDWQERLAVWNAGCLELAFDECDECGRLILPGEKWDANDTGWVAHVVCPVLEP